MRVAGYDDPELLAQCSKGEKITAITEGCLFLLYVVLLTIVLIFLVHNLLQTAFSVLITMMSILVAIFIGLVDHVAFIRSAIFPAGMRSLRRGGFGANVTIGADAISRVCKTIRVALMLLLAFLTAIFVGLSLNGDAVRTVLTKQFYSLNAVAAQKAAKDEDAKRARVQKEYELALGAEASLASEVDRLLKQSNRKTSDATTSKLVANDGRLAQVRAALEEKRQILDRLDTNRPSNIEAAIEASPGFVPRDLSLVARIKALFQVVHDDPWAAVPTVLIDLFILGVDAAFLTLKGIGRPSTYCMGAARKHLRALVHEARLAEAERSEDQTPEMPERPEPQGPQAAPQKRGPGRPRKNGLDHTAKVMQ
ncbi:hypothetical protein [Bradyrhizobium iriomotense]|uniref:hypothetical protein n=1 Tax=Bradyrhizobium iriomotense TaxID=441950 RepID=UPI0024E107A3|nr:hypothetical protein [Bradyrhizobium iriomotense]